jgi:hypothetical protein
MVCAIAHFSGAGRVELRKRTVARADTGISNETYSMHAQVHAVFKQSILTLGRVAVQPYTTHSTTARQHSNFQHSLIHEHRIDSLSHSRLPLNHAPR